MANEVNNNEKLQQLLKGQLDKEHAQKESASKEITKVLTFLLGDQVYGIEIPYIIEIIEVSPITMVPGVPNYIKGIINVRSKIVPVINVRGRFGKEEIEFTDRTCIIIVSVDDASVGLIVDCVSDVLSVTEQHISKTPELYGVNRDKFIKFVLEMNEEIKLVLDIPKLLDEQMTGDDDMMIV